MPTYVLAITDTSPLDLVSLNCSDQLIVVGEAAVHAVIDVLSETGSKRPAYVVSLSILHRKPPVIDETLI